MFQEKSAHLHKLCLLVKKNEHVTRKCWSTTLNQFWLEGLGESQNQKKFTLRKS